MRRIIDFNRNWNFSKGAPEEITAWEQVSLPHTWNALDGQDGGGDYYQGLGTYKKTIVKPEDAAKTYIRFGAASKKAEIYVNGEKLGEHSGGFSSFTLDLTGHLKDGENELMVVVNNSNQLPIYPRMADFTFFGGLYRGAELITFTSEDHFAVDIWGADGLFVTPGADGSVKVSVHTDSELPIKVELADAEGGVCANAQGTADGKELVLQMKTENPHLWDGLEDPYLYTVKAVLGDGEDEIAAKIGFRSYQVDAARGFFLNGRSYPLHGVTRHQCRENMGWAITEREHMEDIAIIREIGANTIRLGHYQHAQELLDLCDRHGLILWAEIPFITVYDNRREADENLRTQMKELICQNFNHPAICFWGLANELGIGGESEPMIAMLKELNAMVKEMDPSRLTTIANVGMTPTSSEQFRISDVTSYNEYMGWYEGTVDDHGPFCDERHNQIPEIPMAISEYGADCLTKWHSASPKCKDYTEEYQALVHEKAYLAFEKREYLWATWLWNMFDFAADGRDEGGCKGRNNKGLVTFDRKIRKQAFYFYKACWSKDPFVYITGKRFLKRHEETIEVKIYSNRKKVTLTVNGKELGTKEEDRIFIFENVPLDRKFNEIIAVTEDGQMDTLIIEKVDQPVEEYIFKEEKLVSANVAQWFADFQSTDKEPEIIEGYLSVDDTLEEIYRYPEGKKAILELIQKPMSLDQPGQAARLDNGGGLSVRSLWNHIGKYFPDGLLYMVNDRLNKIKKDE